MSLIEFFPPLGSAGGGASTFANNAWSGTNTFGAEVDIDGALTIGASSLALNGSSQTIGSTATLVRVTGSTGSSTINLPSSPLTNQIVLVDNQASVSWTLGGNGSNVDGAASKTVPAAGAFAVCYTGSVWESLTPSPWLSLTWSGTTSFTGQLNATGELNVQTRFVMSSQAASTTPFTITGTSGAYVASSYAPTGAQTINLPSAPTSNQIFWIVDEGLNAGTNNITVSGNGKDVNGASSITLAKNGAAVCVRYNNTAWFVIGAYNYP